MADEANSDDWLNTSVDQWLSEEPAKGPAEDDAWHEQSGFLRAFGTHHPDAPDESGGSGKPASEWLAENYDSDRAGFNDAIAAFRQRLMYSFPDVPQMTIDDIALAAAWITDMEKYILARQIYAVLHKGLGREGYARDIEAACAEMKQMKQIYARQRERIAEDQRARVAQINAERDAYAREQHKERQRLWQETNDEIAAMREDTAKKRSELQDKQHREFLRYIRGEQVIARIEFE